jgi:hypothetical protein
MERCVSLVNGPLRVLKSRGSDIAGGGAGRKKVAIGLLYKFASLRSSVKVGGLAPDSIWSSISTLTFATAAARSGSMLSDVRDHLMTSGLDFVQSTEFIAVLFHHGETRARWTADRDIY